MAEPPYRVAPTNPLFAAPDATAVPQWRIDLGRKFVVGDRLAHEEWGLSTAAHDRGAGIV